MRTIKRLLGAGLIACAILLAVLLINTLRFSPLEDQASATVSELAPALDIAEKLSQAIRFETVSRRARGSIAEQQAFHDFLAWLPQAFPHVHKVMNREVVGGFTPLYHWQGSDPSLPPVLLTGHYDVVPVEAATIDQWEHPPFAGAIVNDYVYGRGAIDNKGAVVALLETAERLIEQGYEPPRSVYLSFGHDEEIGGEQGAAAVVEHLAQAGVLVDWVLDEGSFVLSGIVKALDQPLASINVAEKGMLTLTLVARAPGGHSSMPPRETAVGTLAAAINRLQQSPVPGGLTGLSEEMFDVMSRHFGFVNRMLFANRWLFGPLIESRLSVEATTDAVLRTTTAPTMLSGSSAENVLPTQASATINFRLHPRDTVEMILAHVRETIDDDRIEIIVSPDHAREATSVSDHTASGFRVIARSSRQSFGSLVVVPGLTIAGTDSRHYAKIAKNAYRFNPFTVERSDLPRIHGLNERISMTNLRHAMTFFNLLLTDLERQ